MCMLSMSYRNILLYLYHCQSKRTQCPKQYVLWSSGLKWHLILIGDSSFLRENIVSMLRVDYFSLLFDYSFFPCLCSVSLSCFLFFLSVPSCLRLILSFIPVFLSFFLSVCTWWCLKRDECIGSISFSCKILYMKLACHGRMHVTSSDNIYCVL